MMMMATMVMMAERSGPTSERAFAQVSPYKLFFFLVRAGGGG